LSIIQLTLPGFDINGIPKDFGRVQKVQGYILRLFPFVSDWACPWTTYHGEQQDSSQDVPSSHLYLLFLKALLHGTQQPYDYIIRKKKKTKWETSCVVAIASRQIYEKQSRWESLCVLGRNGSVLTIKKALDIALHCLL